MPGLLEECGIQKMIAQYEVSVFGPLNVTNAVLPYMRKERSGTVVIVGSRCAWTPEKSGQGFYGSSKAAVQTMGETLAVELAPLNIRVLIVEPGSFRTEGILTSPFDVANPIPTTRATSRFSHYLQCFARKAARRPSESDERRG
ncbi:hypothetical protein BU15DRAFT_77978 [Melanogaster broomeanus]|nr:hypothetical protein BU15DRAFT_77978 [Melanogaster broomeanus]